MTVIIRTQYCQPLKLSSYYTELLANIITSNTLKTLIYRQMKW